MALSKSNKFTSVELVWAEKQLKSWMDYLDNNPYDKCEDRTKLRPTKAGGSVLEVIATVETQQKHQRDTMKDYLQLLEVVEKLRQAEAARAINVRGGIEIPHRMKENE